MARPSSQGAQAVSQDVMDLTRILRRVESDTRRPDAEKEGLIEHLKGALSILLVGKRAGDEPVRKAPVTKAQKKAAIAARGKRVASVAAELAKEDEAGGKRRKAS